MKIKIICLLAIFVLAGCASQQISLDNGSSSGIYHKIEKGETLWSVSQAYNVDIEKLLKYNRIPDMTNVNEGQLIFIPGTDASLVSSPLVSKGDFIWPVEGKVTYKFGAISGNVVNKGLEIYVSKNEDVKASNKGKVVFIAKSLAGYGDTMIIEHGNNLLSVYANLDKINAEVGKHVLQAECIASIKQGDMLHFEIRKGAKPVNPLFYLP